MKSYAIIGTGAIGGYCAARLHQAGFDVHCLMGSDYSFVKQHGLTLIADGETINVPINVYKKASEIPTCDVVIISLKTTANSILKSILPQLMHLDTMIVVLQNGIGIEKEIAEFIEAKKIVGGSCMLKVTKDSPGVVRYFGFNSVELAQYYLDEHQTGITKQVELLAKDLEKAGINCIPIAHLPTMRWKKLTGNIPINGLSVVLNAYTQDLIQHPTSYQLILMITKEIISAATQCGAYIPEDFYQFRLKMLKSFKTMEKNYTSMKEDFDAKKPLELQAIYENTINIAKQHHISMPLTEMLYQQLIYLNEKNLSKKNN